MDKISVTISTYKRPKGVKDLLNVLVNQSISHYNYEVIVCDSNSCEETTLLIRDFKFSNPSFDLIHVHTVNILAAKRNLGIRMAKYPVILFLDDDCIPESYNFLEKHLSFFKNGSNEKKIICGQVRFPTSWVNKSNYYRFRDREGFFINSNITIPLDFNTIVVMNMSFEKDLFIKSVGEVNENFVGYGMEDQELGWRLMKEGYQILGIDAKIYHFESSAGITGYGLKIFHTARDGSTTLLQQCKDAFKEIRIFRLIDKDYPDLLVIQKILYAFIRLLFFSNPFFYLAKKIAIFIENKPFLYNGYLYRYILACFYIKGTLARNEKIKNANNGWYS